MIMSEDIIMYIYWNRNLARMQNRQDAAADEERQDMNLAQRIS